MLKPAKTEALLLSIFVFAFLYRLLLMLWEGFPPGADIGLHNSVIYSISGSGNIDFLYNFYHMGGGTSLTFPGYHIFTTFVVSLTGLEEYIAHAVIASLFSSLIVLCGFLITKIWSTTAGCIIALLVAISRFDIEMLLWAGYPNAITLFLLPLTFYLFLQRDRFSKIPFIISTAILTGSIFLTHSLSAAVYAAVICSTILVSLIIPKKIGIKRKQVLHWIVALLLGATLVSPFLIHAVPTTFEENSTLADSEDSKEIKKAISETKILPLWMVLPLFGVIPGLLLFSKKYLKKFLTAPTLLVVIWLAIPLLMTQTYLFELYLDFNRFLYFIMLPVMIFMAILIDHGSDFFAKIANLVINSINQISTQKIVQHKYLKISSFLSYKTIYVIFVVFFLLFSFIFLPVFMTPTMKAGKSIQEYYQTMNNAGWEAIQWAKENTPINAVFVSDAHYGWWLGGFAQRQTLSAVDPQYLSLKREVDNATFAVNLMNTDYVVDNQLIQVQEDGYLSRHNPRIIVSQNWTNLPYTFFTFTNKTEIYYNDGSGAQYVLLGELKVKEVQFENDTEQAKITTIRGNDDLDYNVTTIMYKGVRFVELKISVTTLKPNVTIEWVNIKIGCNAEKIEYDDKSTLCLIDEGVKAFGQLIFDLLPYRVTEVKDDKVVELMYTFNNKDDVKIGILAGAYSVTDRLEYYVDKETRDTYFKPIITDNMNSALALVENFDEKEQLEVFNYSLEIEKRKITHIACRNYETRLKFVNDPLFSLVFINEEVAIFRVNTHLS
ncbi:MAG: hypothetical protein PHC63_02220 [Candidatus Bathyarchaeota archaeon]|nr:hypothetical protein [Candidatus Bathyarchaeota archaeon]